MESEVGLHHPLSCGYPCCECAGVGMIFPQAARFGGRLVSSVWVFANESPRNFKDGINPLVPPRVIRICAAVAIFVSTNVSVSTLPSASFCPRTLVRGKIRLSNDHRPIV